MAKKAKLPEKIDTAGNLFQQQTRLEASEHDYSGFGTDGLERIAYSTDPFCQGPEYDFDEFH